MKIRAGNAFRTDDLFEVVPGEAVEAPIERRPLELRFAGDTYAQTFVTQPFPNPFSDRLEWGITAANEGPATVVLVDAAGRVIALKNTILTAGYQTISLDQLSSLPAGWYSWRIAFEGSVATGKLFKKSE